MKRYIARQVLAARLTALALIALCLLQIPVRAQDETVYIVLFPSVGLADGQRLRLTVSNLAGGTVRAEVRSRHSGGVMVCLGDGSVRFIQAGISSSFDINRSDISVAGEDGTGRIQLCASISLARLNSSETINPVVASMEIIDITDGTSNTLIVGEVIPSTPTNGGGRDLLLGGDSQDVLMGFVPGQRLRVTLSRPPSSGPDYLPSRIKLFDTRGRLIAQSPDLVIPPDDFRSFDFNRDALSQAGEPGTRRLQVRVRVEPASADPSSFTTDPTASGMLVGSFELIDNSTGRTTACQNNLKQIGLAFHNFNGSGH